MPEGAAPGTTASPPVPRPVIVTLAAGAMLLAVPAVVGYSVRPTAPAARFPMSRGRCGSRGQPRTGR